VVFYNTVTAKYTSNHPMKLAHQATHQKADGKGNTDDGQWPLTNPIAGLFHQSILYCLPRLTAGYELIGGLVDNRRQTINRAVRAVLPRMHGAIRMLG
jgi:hypothetical protein